MWSQQAKHRQQEAVEMSGNLQTSAADYEEKMQHNTIQDAGCVSVFRADVQQTVLIKEEAPDEIRIPGVDQQDPDTLKIKEEDPWASLEREQLYVKKETVITDVEQTVLIKEEAPEIQRPGVDQQDSHALYIKEEEEDPWSSRDVKKETAITVFPADVQQTVLIKEEAAETCWPGVDQKDPNTLNIKEEEEEPQASLEREQLCVKQETGDTGLALTVILLKSEDDEVEDGPLPTSSSADQTKAATRGEDSRGTGTTRNPDLNTEEDNFSSSETEVSEDDKDDEDVMDPDFQLKNLSDSGSEPEDNDKDWKESRAPQSEMSTSCLIKQKCFGVNKTGGSSKTFQSKQKPFRCDECGKTFHKESQRNTHMKIHKGEKPLVCDFCELRFEYKSTLNTHLRIHTGEKPFVCDFCELKFGRKSALNSHMRIHTGEKPFVCDHCGQRFGRKSYIKLHMRIHTGEKPFACDCCGQRFGHKSALNTHMRIHTGEKPFACDGCGQRFGYKSTLNKHMRIHTGEKPFVCNHCGKRFREKPTLNTHMKIHTGEKPFECECCGKRFREKSTLNSHMRIHTRQAVDANIKSAPKETQQFTQNLS